METEENKALKKRKMLEQCILKQQLLIDDLRSRRDKLKQVRGIEAQEANGEIEKSIVVSRYDHLQETLSFAKEEMRTLDYLKMKINDHHEYPELGAAVVTDNGPFFIAIDIGEFTVDGKHYYGISTQSPFFKAMRGKNSEEAFYYRNSEYVIEEVF